MGISIEKKIRGYLFGANRKLDFPIGEAVLTIRQASRQTPRQTDTRQADPFVRQPSINWTQRSSIPGLDLISPVISSQVNDLIKIVLMISAKSL